MPNEIAPHAETIPQTGEATWFPPVEDDVQGLRDQRPPPKDLQWVLFGKDGLRAGWSVMLFLLVFVGLFFLQRPLLRGLNLMRFAPRRGSPAGPLVPVLFSHGVPFVFAMAAAFVVSRVEGRSLAAYGIGGLRGRARQFAAGLGWGFVLFSLLILVLRVTGLLVFDGSLMFGADVLKWGAAWAFSFLCVALFEEYLTRGFLQFTLARGLAGIAGALGMGERGRRVLGFWLVALFFSFLFGFGHKGNPGESPLGLVAAGLIGLVFAFSLWRTGSLWWAVGYHAAWDWAESCVYGVRDSGTTIQHALVATHPLGSPWLSGGLTGPEGSIYVLGAIGLTVAAIAVTLPSQTGSPSDPGYTPNGDLLRR